MTNKLIPLAAAGVEVESPSGPRAVVKSKWARKLLTFLMVFGPGLIVMVADNDAGAVSTYSQAGAQYGTHLLWIVLLLLPVTYFIQEMVVRLGIATGKGHAAMIYQRFREVVGAVLADRSGTGELPDAGDGIRRHRPGAEQDGGRSAPRRAAGGRGSEF